MQRPAPHQYGLVPGTAEAGWTPPATQIYPPPNLQYGPTPLTNPAPHPYQEGLEQTSRPEAYQPRPYQEGLEQTSRPEAFQPAQQAQHNGPWRSQLPAYREQTNYDPRQVTQQGQQHQVAENTEARQLANFDPRLLSRHDGQHRQVSESNEHGRRANYDPRLVSYQQEQAYQAAEPLEPRRVSNYDPRLAPYQGGHPRRVSEDTEPGRLANYDPRLVSPREQRPRRVSESTDPIWRSNNDPRQLPYREGQSYQVVENTRSSRPANRNVSAPLPPQLVPQSSSNYFPPPTSSGIGRPQRTGLPPPLVGSPQNANVAQEVSRPPIPQTYRSTSQPPATRNVRQPSPQSKKLHKQSQPDIRAPQLPQSPDASPRVSPALQSRGRSGSLVAPPTFGDISTPQDASSRPSSYHSDAGSSDGKGSKRRSWLPGRSRQASQDMTAIMNGPGAWIIGGQNKVSYNVEPLLSAKKVHTISSMV